MFNEVSFIGHLGKDPDIQVTKNQETVARLSVGSSVWDKENHIRFLCRLQKTEV